MKLEGLSSSQSLRCSEALLRELVERAERHSRSKASEWTCASQSKARRGRSV